MFAETVGFDGHKLAGHDLLEVMSLTVMGLSLGTDQYCWWTMTHSK